MWQNWKVRRVKGLGTWDPLVAYEKSSVYVVTDLAGEAEEVGWLGRGSQQPIFTMRLVTTITHVLRR
jgi:hypothetical protein